jgi:hypothetical protein
MTILYFVLGVLLSAALATAIIEERSKKKKRKINKRIS